MGRLVGRLPIEGHHGCRQTGAATQLCAPAVAHGSDFNVEGAAAYGFVEVMHGHVVGVRSRQWNWGTEDDSQPLRPDDQAKRGTKTGSTAPIR